MAESRNIYTEQAYHADFEADAGNTPADFKGLGYYKRTSLEDIINNFIVAYIGEDKVLTKVPEYEVAFWAQRAIQEFSYDILHSEKSVEIELGAALQFPLPQDYVNYVKISVVGDDGVKRTLLPSRTSNNPTAILQDADFSYLYDSSGNVQKAAKSTTAKRFQDPSNPSNTSSLAQDYYHTNYNDDNFSYFNKRFGSNPEDMSRSGTYFIDNAKGIIFFNGTFAGIARGEASPVVLDYISDGLSDNGDLSKVLVPKLAEEALYAQMLYNLAKLRPATAQLAPFYKKEASAKTRNTKIRLSNYKSEEMVQVLRGKSKWIKH
tara:strand:- start:1666 stop:2625 length:960 start_codon:yes stop_codon:yes gene_type:complete